MVGLAASLYPFFHVFEVGSRVGLLLFDVPDSGAC